MRINHNISSMTTAGSVFKVNRAMSKSLERLSTGQRINKAADDAAGLGVSENLRTQIRGLTQALKNTQDAIAMLTIADGALNEQAAILQRMRELVIQAKNDTYTATERHYMYLEFSHLMDELDRIAQSTNYNGMQLFATPSAAGLDQTINGLHVRLYTQRAYPNGLPPGSPYQTAHATDYSWRVWTDRNNDPLGPTEESSAHHFNMFIGANYTRADANAYLAENCSWGDRGAANIITIQFAQMDSNALLSPYPAGWTERDLGNGKPLNMGSAREMWDSFAFNGDTSFEVTDPRYDNEDTVMDAYGPGNDFSERGEFVGGDFGVQEKLSLLLNLIDGHTNEINFDTIEYAFMGQKNTTGLNRINKMRAAIGALINRLEASVNNTLNQIANQQSAESIIRDADFAAETIMLSRNQILTLASTAMLAQSNIVPQSVLQLLQ